MKPANLIAESEVYMKIAEIKLGVYKVISIAAKNHGQAFSQSPLLPSLRSFTDAGMVLGAQMTIMQNLQYTEHLSEPMADLVNILAKDFDYSQLGEDVLRCVPRPISSYYTDE
jgi:condensin complex subunit 1